MPTTLILGQHSKFPIFAKGSDGAARPAGWSATVSDYSKGFVALQGGSTIFVGSKAVGPFSVTFSGHSQDGTPLPDVVRNYVVAPVPVPQADHLELGDDVVEGWYLGTPDDPGTDVISGNL